MTTFRIMLIMISILFLSVMYFYIFTVPTFANTSTSTEPNGEASTTKVIIEPLTLFEKVLQSTTDEIVEMIVQKETGDLASKYAKLYDSCRFNN